jgi:hypothetical protein
MATACRPTACLTSKFIILVGILVKLDNPQTEVKDHPANLGMTYDQ